MKTKEKIMAEVLRLRAECEALDVKVTASIAEVGTRLTWTEKLEFEKLKRRRAEIETLEWVLRD